MDVPLASRRRDRALAVQQLQHGLPAVGLLLVGVQGLKAGAHGFELALGLVEVTTSALLIATILRSLRQARALGRWGLRHAHGVDWIDIWAAAVLFAEAAERWHLTRHIARPTILTAMVTLAFGLFHGRVAAAVARRRSLRVSDDGIYLGGPPFKRFRARWNEITHIAIDENAGTIRTRAGRTRGLDLKDLENAAAVRAALEEAARRLETANRDRSNDPTPAGGRQP
jgi:hypothetical protein